VDYPTPSGQRIRHGGDTGGDVRILVNRSTCAGIGICEAIDPERFEVRADGKTHLLKDDLEDNAALEVAHEAVARCPTQSLGIVD
jgi:ferredoxin